MQNWTPGEMDYTAQEVTSYFVLKTGEIWVYLINMEEKKGMRR